MRKKEERKVGKWRVYVRKTNREKKEKEKGG